MELCWRSSPVVSFLSQFQATKYVWFCQLVVHQREVEKRRFNESGNSWKLVGSQLSFLVPEMWKKMYSVWVLFAMGCSKSKFSGLLLVQKDCFTVGQLWPLLNRRFLLPGIKSSRRQCASFAIKKIFLLKVDVLVDKIQKAKRGWVRCQSWVFF